MRKFICGDLHGNIDALNRKLLEIDFEFNEDIMFSVGDLIDRGLDSMRCLRLLKEPWFHAVRGNHEDLMIHSILHGEHPGLWYQNGGAWSIKVDQAELKELAVLAEQLPYAITIDDAVGICHAQPPSLDWNDAKNPTEYHKQKMIWGRTRIYKNRTKNIENTYHGHTIVKELEVSGNAIFIDTGAYFYNKLTVVEL